MTELGPESFRSLPRWVKAYLAARIARRALDSIDARRVPSAFAKVLDTLEVLEHAVETGVEIEQTNRGFTDARHYAEVHGGNSSSAAHVQAALAIDDAFALATNEARLGRSSSTSPEEFQIRKLLFARDCALKAATPAGVTDALSLAFSSDVERVRNAIVFGISWEDTQPVARDFLAQYCVFDTSESLAGQSLVELSPSITDEMIRRLSESPMRLHELSPRGFEDFVARVFESFGFAVELTAQTRDGGRDVIAIRHSPTCLKYLIECKKYAATNKVGVAIVQRLHGVVAGDSATAGIVATTSTFTGPAMEFMTRPTVEYRLSGKDFDGLRGWLATWEQLQRVRAVMGARFTLTESGLVVPDHT